MNINESISTEADKIALQEMRAYTIVEQAFLRGCPKCGGAK